MKLDAALMVEPALAADLAVELEGKGYDGVYSFEGVNDPFTPLTLAASRTHRLELLTAITVAFARNPMSMALAARDVQQLSGGRFILGLGTQVKAHVERRYSMPWSRPAARMREFVLALRHIWDAWENGARLSFEGEFYQHTLSSPLFTPKPNGLPPIPIYVAAVGPLMTQMAGEVADGLMVHPFHSAQSLAELTLPNVQQGAARGEREAPCQISAQVITAIGTDPAGLEQAIGAARAQVGFYASTPAYRPVLDVHGWGDLQPLLAGLVREGKWAELGDHISDAMLEAFAVIGSPEEAVSQIRARCGDHVDRVSPIIYNPEKAIYSAIAEAFRASA